LRGYWEKSFVTLHVDALLVIQAAASGLKEKVISCPVYHQEHDRRYDHSADNNEYRNEYLHFQQQAEQMLENKKAKVYNDENWGLSTFDLPEKIV